MLSREPNRVKGYLPGGYFFEDSEMKKRRQEVVKEEDSARGEEEMIEEEKPPWLEGRNSDKHALGVTERRPSQSVLSFSHFGNGVVQGNGFLDPPCSPRQLPGPHYMCPHDVAPPK